VILRAAVEEAACRVCPHCGETFTPERYATRGPGRPPKEPAKRSGQRRCAPARLAAALAFARQKPSA